MSLLSWPEFTLFEYEYDLARREAFSIFGEAVVDETPQGLVLHDSVDHTRVDHLTYFGAVVVADKSTPTLQSRIEAAHREVTGRRGNKQSTRYLVHDLHEYKGKFNPQMARALMNVFGASADVVIDPYSGSGTTAVEALRLGKDAIALDMNPLAAWMTRIKGETLQAPPEELLREFAILSETVQAVADDVRRPKDSDLARLWSEDSLTYLLQWFPAESLWPMARVLNVVSGKNSLAGDLVRLAVSNIVREVSWQLPEDLRIRRRPAPWTPPSYSDVLRRALIRIGNALAEQILNRDSPRRGTVTSVIGDARKVHLAVDASRSSSNDRRVIITSPPYATALPYIDTDRLSLVALGLVDPAEVRALEMELTGSREWRPRDAASWKQRLLTNGDDLPRDIVALCLQIHERNIADNAGFRRLAVPGLLYRYFVHMRQAIESWGRVLGDGEHAVLVVGANRTGGRVDPIEIDTPRLTAECAEQVGFELVELIPFQVWPRYGLHAKNGVPGESAVVLRRVT